MSHRVFNEKKIKMILIENVLLEVYIILAVGLQRQRKRTGWPSGEQHWISVRQKLVWEEFGDAMENDVKGSRKNVSGRGSSAPKILCIVGMGSLLT